MTKTEIEILSCLMCSELLTSAAVMREYYFRYGGPISAPAVDKALNALEVDGLADSIAPSTRHISVFWLTPEGHRALMENLREQLEPAEVFEKPRPTEQPPRPSAVLLYNSLLGWSWKYVIDGASHAFDTIEQAKAAAEACGFQIIGDLPSILGEEGEETP